ncbi:NUDIX hydrolase [Yinghuangia soli]|uniref:NUDIX domain-containing protein n=1 Tax=Yinghuangia soli TaxID=2908204 RepID=A0AA41Q568_9ACTN|nr:NUDIX domain-containing protein [Yinghuangia soli]MCF2531790.1 NUDIX domain-containing protein [Yinghuangia soli]
MGDRTASTVIDVHIILRNQDRILLSQRGGPYCHGQWHVPSGKLDTGETVLDAAVREAWEEAGVAIDPGDLRLVHTVHHQGPDVPDRIGLFFEATRWHGEPDNREPNKCLALEWFAIHNLPSELIPYPAAGIRGYLDDTGGISVHGW